MTMIASPPAVCVQQDRIGHIDAARAAERHGEFVNDVHSRLNPTRVRGVVAPDSLACVRQVLARAAEEGRPVTVSAARHAMGGQQFGTDGILLDARRLDRVLRFDDRAGTVEVEAGILWPQLIAHLRAAQAGQAHADGRPDLGWGIIQKQTGADQLSIGGALAANVHGRGLRLKPFIGDVESFTLLDADGRLHNCSRTRNAELFRLAAGGYGMFGFVYSVVLRLARRQRLRRVVREATVGELPDAFERRIAAGFLYGDFQFAIDPANPADFLHRGVFSCYEPVADGTPVPAAQAALSDDDWRELLYLAHADKSKAYALYAAHYLRTSGQIYLSDEHQLTPYLDGYHREIDRRMGRACSGSEMITELYVPREALPAFMAAARADFRENGTDVIYGTVRLIEGDDESFLPWAKERYACVIFNLHVDHTPASVARAAAAFRRLIDRAIELGGSYYLTYHRFATKEQVLACYPQFPTWLQMKKRYDPGELFQSDWCRHHKALMEAE